MRTVTRVLRREIGRRLLPLVSSKDAASSLRDLQRRIDRVRTVIDVGASDGRWSRMTEGAFPDAEYLLVEANAAHEPSLVRHCRRRPRASYVLVAATSTDGGVAFDATDPFHGVAGRPGSHTPGMTEHPGRSLSSLVQERRLEGPYLVKLDTHGHEREILQGMQDILADTEALIVEVYNPAVGTGLPPFWEICHEIVEMGFDVFDLCEPLYRPADGAFWQADLVFVRS